MSCLCQHRLRSKNHHCKKYNKNSKNCVCVCVCNSPQSCGSHDGFVIASFYPPGENLQLIIARSMGKAATLHTTHPILLLKEGSNCLITSEPLQLERGTNLSLPSDRLRRYHPAIKQCVCVCVCDHSILCII